MAMNTALPRTPGVHPAAIPGGLGRDQHADAGARSFRNPSPAASCGCTAQFLAPSTAEQEKLARRASDCGEVAMARLRHPFTVAAA